MRQLLLLMTMLDEVEHESLTNRAWGRHPRQATPTSRRGGPATHTHTYLGTQHGSRRAAQGARRAGTHAGEAAGGEGRVCKPDDSRSVVRAQLRQSGLARCVLVAVLFRAQPRFDHCCGFASTRDTPCFRHLLRHFARRQGLFDAGFAGVARHFRLLAAPVPVQLPRAGAGDAACRGRHPPAGLQVSLV